MATYKDTVRVATIGNITLSGTQTIDNISLAIGNRVLVKDQTTATENGIYAVASGGWSRDTDANTSELMSPETTVRVSEGAVNAHTEWSLSTQAPITLVTTALTFVKTGFNGQTTKAMADADQTLTLAEAASRLIKTTGALTATRTLTLPAPASDGASYERSVHSTCTGASITVTTGSGQTFLLDPGAKADLKFTTTGVLPIADYVLDPRDFGCPWNGVDDDLPGLQAMIDSIPASRSRVTQIQLPRGAGYCSGNWEIYKPVEITGHGKNSGAEGNHIKFAPLRGIIFHGAFSSPNPRVSSADHSTLRDVNVISTRAIVSDDVGNWGLVIGYQLGTITATWDRLPTNVQLGSCALRGSVASPATVDSSNQEYYGDGHTRNTTHLVMFRCTTTGTKGSSVPASFATSGLAQLGTQITATNGTAVWTVESIPKDYANDTSYVAGQRVFVPGDNDHVFECVEAGTSIELASTTIAADSNGAKLLQTTINVADTSNFPSTGVICVVTPNGGEFVYYTGKTATSFTGCDIVRELKAASGVMSTGGAVTGPFPYAKWGIPVRCARHLFTPGHRQDFYDRTTPITAGSNGAALPQGTINVDSTADFAASGTLKIWTGSAYTTVTYTGKTTTSFTGCTGGTGTLTTGSEVGQGIKWKEISSANVVILGNWCTVEDCYIAGATGPAVWISNSYLNGYGGGSNFWALRRYYVRCCGAGITINGFNNNGGESSFAQYDFLGAGHTNVDEAAYLNINRRSPAVPLSPEVWANGKFGNGGTAIKDRELGNNAHRCHYVQTSGGMPYRNDLLGIVTPFGNYGVWEYIANETALAPLFYSPALIKGAVHGVHSATNATVLSGVASRDIVTRAPFVSDPSKEVVATFGPRNHGVAGPVSFNVAGDSYAIGYGVTEDQLYFPAMWFTFGKANGAGFFDEQLFAFPRPSPVGATWPGGQAVGQSMPMWITQNRVWIGAAPNFDPASIGLETAQPSSGYYVQGSIVFKNNAAVGSPLGWVCLTGGVPGKWQELENVFTPTSLPMNLLLRGSFSASPWNGTASAGGFSSSKSASESTNPPSAGAAVNGFTPADFDGTNDTLTLIGTLEDYVSVSAYSGWAWVYADSVATDSSDGSNNDLIVGNSTSVNFAVGMRSSGKVMLYHFDTGAKNAEANFTIGAWQFVHWRFDGRKICIGVNGVWGTPVAAGNLGSLANGMKLGAAQPGHFSDMTLLETALTDVALTNADLENVFKAGKARYGL